MSGNLSRRQIETAERKKKKIVYGVTAFICCYLLFFFLFGEMNIFRYFSMRSAYRRNLNEINLLKEENARLKKEAEALRSDPEAIERVARESLGMAKKGEIIYEFPKDPPQTAEKP